MIEVKLIFFLYFAFCILQTIKIKYYHLITNFPFSFGETPPPPLCFFEKKKKIKYILIKLISYF